VINFIFLPGGVYGGEQFVFGLGLSFYRLKIAFQLIGQVICYETSVDVGSEIIKFHWQPPL
jgi:hypothetical protein